MAFPGTYNFNYYKGDTFEFRVYPKDSSGAIFDLTDYTVKFTISTTRGTAGLANQIEGVAAVASDNTYILCAIDPESGESLNAGTQYVYDVEIKKIGEDYDYIYTLLTGNVTVTDQVTQPYESVTPPATTTFVVTQQTGSKFYFDSNPTLNPSLTLTKGQTYVFDLGNDPSLGTFWITSVNGPYVLGSEYSDGVTNNGASTGTITFVVPSTAPSSLGYASETDPTAFGPITIIDGAL